MIHFMRYLLFILLLWFFPYMVAAHTSDQRYQDGYIVDLSTAPVAPWVGEKVGMSFVFRDPMSGLATTSVVSASYSIDALMREKSKVQETVFQSATFPVTTGGFVADHVFTEVGTYDLHLAFIDAEGKEHTTGFRKQVRSGGGGEAIAAKAQYAILGIALIMAILGFVLGKFSRKY